MKIVKVCFKGQTRRLQLPAPYDFCCLHQLVAKSFQLNQAFSFNYVDPEGDVCTVQNDCELSEAFRTTTTTATTAHDGQPYVLRFTVVPLLEQVTTSGILAAALIASKREEEEEEEEEEKIGGFDVTSQLPQHEQVRKDYSDSNIYVSKGMEIRVPIAPDAKCVENDSLILKNTVGSQVDLNSGYELRSQPGGEIRLK